MDEKSSPLFPVGCGGGGGAVVTNDWCIIETQKCKIKTKLHQSKGDTDSSIHNILLETVLK